jgi:hypothetical protein
MMPSWFDPSPVLLVALLALAPGCERAAKAQPTAASASAAAPGPAPAPDRIQALLHVSRAEPAVGARIPFDEGAALEAPAGWAPQGAGDLGSALDTSTQKEIKAHCYLTARLQKGDPTSGIKLWASSAGGKPATFTGPEPITIGPERVAAELWWGRDGVTLGSPGQKHPGVTIAIRPKARPELLLVGVVRDDAPEATREKLAGCLASFRLTR